MERNFKRISDELKLPQESRERIRSQIVSCQKRTEDIPVKKPTLRSRVPLIAAAVVMMMALTLTAAAAVAGHLFKNDVIVSSRDDIFKPSSTSEGVSGVSSPNGTPPSKLEDIVELSRRKSNDWNTGSNIDGGFFYANDGVVFDYLHWSSVDVLSSDPALRSRRMSRGDGAEKMEYTAENPKNLLDTLTGRVTFDLDWLDKHYDYVPDGNTAYVVSDAEGNYIGEYIEVFYAKKDGSGYIRVGMTNNALEDDSRNSSYIIEGSYETAYYYTVNGCEFLITMNTGNVWVTCSTSCTDIDMYGAYLTTDEVEDILDHLSLTINE